MHRSDHVGAIHAPRPGIQKLSASHFHMSAITLGANTGNTSLAVPPAHFHQQQVCPNAEPKQLAQAGSAERQLKIWLWMGPTLATQR